MNIGSKIRELRKQRGITQEQLAESVGVSFQAVSKWENNIALPDITLAPALASYFRISMDTLFDFNLKQIELDAQRIADSAVPFRETAPSECRRILEEGLKQYPENDILLNHLLYVINYKGNPDETIAVASKLIEKTTFEDIKYDALRFLANAYEAKGDLQSAEAALEQIPEIYFTKLTELAFLLSGEPKREAAEKQKWISFEHLLQMMGQLVEYYEEKENLEAAVSETKKALALVSIMDNPCFDGYKQNIEELLERLSKKS